MVTEHLYGNIFARDTDRVLTHLYLLCDAECKSTKKKQQDVHVLLMPRSMLRGA